MLAWNEFFCGSLFGMMRGGANDNDPLDRCDHQCEFTHDRTRWADADLVVYHGEGGDLRDELVPPVDPSGRRLNLFYQLEAPPNTSPWYIKLPANFFNATMTYSRAASGDLLWAPYDRFEPIDANTRREEVWTPEEARKFLYGNFFYISS